MAEIRTVELNVKTNNKDVQSQFDNLRKSIEKTTQEVEDLSKEFGDNSQEADKARQELGKLTIAYDSLSKSATDLNASFEQVYGELQPLTARMGEAEDRLYELALAGKQGTKEYNDLLQAVSGYRKVQMQTDMVVDASATTMNQKLLGAVGGVAAGFEVAEGAAALFGVESSKLQETMVKLQSVMAISQGIQGLKEAGSSFKALGSSAMTALKGIRTGIAATGIGLLVIAVGLLVANFDKLKEAFSSALGKAKAFEKGVSEQAAAARAAIDNFGEYERTLRRLGKTQDEIESKRRERFKRAIEDTEKELKANKKVYQEQLKNLETVQTFDKFGLNATGRALFGDEEDAKAQREKVKETRAQLEKLKNDKFEFEQKIKDDAKQKREEDLQDYQDKIKAKQDLINADLEKIRENNRVALEENQARLRTEQEQEEFLVNQKFNEQIKLAKKYKKDTTQLEIDQANQINEIRLKYQEIDYKQKEEARQKERDAIKQANDLKKQAEEEFQAQIEEIDEANFQAGLQKTMTQDEYALELVRQKYFALEEAAKGNAEQLKIIEEAKTLEIEAIKAKAAEAEAARQKRNKDFAVEMAISGFNTIASLTDLFGKKSEKAARIAFRINKGAQIASATMSTYQSATQAYASQLIPGDPSSPIRGAVAAGAAVFAGLANVAKIVSQKFEGGGSSGGGGGAASAAAGGGAQMAAPQFQTIGTSGINQLATLQQQPTQAYVVSGHVTSAQALDRNRVQNATL
jgi:predicted  nucleic acid-binding Zn-ribbon protein